MQIAASAKHEYTRRSLISDSDFQRFGHLIVRACLYNREFFELAAVVIDYDAVKGGYTKNDFLDGEFGSNDGLIFSGMLEFRSHYYEGNPYPSNPGEWAAAIAPHIQRKFDANPEWPKEFFKNCMLALVALYPPPQIGEYDLACDGLVDYVRGVRLRRVTMTLRSLDPSAQAQRIDEVKMTIRIPGEQVSLVTVDDHISTLLNYKTSTHTFRTGLRSYDLMYGDYAAPGDAWLAAGLPGAGKTVLACQIAGATAAIGRKVLHITTEVAAPTCILRACAATQSISYAALQAVRGSGKIEATDYGLQLRQWANTVGRNIFCVDYASVPGPDYETRVRKILDKFVKMYGHPPELFLFDWIGKAANIEFADAWSKREHYNRIADFNARLADELEIVSWTFAQADKDIRNRVDIADTATADSKALSQPMEGALFLTSLIEPHQAGGDEAQDAYQKKQWWVIPKCREREPKKLPVIRRFEMQRFDDAR